MNKNTIKIHALRTKLRVLFVFKSLKGETPPLYSASQVRVRAAAEIIALRALQALPAMRRRAPGGGAAWPAAAQEEEGGAAGAAEASDLPCNVRGEGGQSLVIGGPFPCHIRRKGV